MKNKGRSPHGERGLKSGAGGLRGCHPVSLPSRGAWIEIRQNGITAAIAQGRSPHGERGLKYDTKRHFGGGALSLPSRGAWIEIC